MASSAAAVYSGGLDFVSAVVDRFPEQDWDRPSPCAGWTALDVLGHLGATTRFGIALLEGRQPAWQPSSRPSDAVEGSPRSWWQGIADRARQLMAGVDLDATVGTPAGPRRVGDGLAFPAVDLYTHGWDIARVAGLDVEIPADAIEFAHSVLDPIPEAQLRSSATFSAAVTVDAGATPTASFIAWTGRDPAWSGPTS